MSFSTALHEQACTVPPSIHSKITFILLMGDIGHCNYNNCYSFINSIYLFMFKLYILLLWVIQQAKGLTPL